MGTIYDNLALSNVQAVLPNASAADILQALTGTSNAFFTQLDTGEKTDVVQAIISSMAPVWLVLMAGGAISFVLSMFLGRDRLFAK